MQRDKGATRVPQVAQEWHEEVSEERLEEKVVLRQAVDRPELCRLLEEVEEEAGPVALPTPLGLRMERLAVVVAEAERVEQGHQPLLRELEREVEPVQQQLAERDEEPLEDAGILNEDV